MTIQQEPASGNKFAARNPSGRANTDVSAIGGKAPLKRRSRQPAPPWYDPRLPFKTAPCFSSTSALANALAMAMVGVRVFPVNQLKRPRIGGWQAAATTDLMAIYRWRNQWRGGGFGAACGDHIVIDIDGEIGLASFEKLERELGPLPATWRTRSGRDGPGFHLWFKCPPGKPPPRNSAGTLLGPGIDVRGAGGFVVIPGSIHPSGKRYAWEVSPEEVEIAVLPDAWYELTMRSGGTRERLSSPRRTSTARGAPRPRPAGSLIIGDGPGGGGFSAPVYRRLCQFFSRFGADADPTELVRVLRVVIAAAPQYDGRDPETVNRFLDGDFMESQVENARSYIRRQGVK